MRVTTPRSDATRVPRQRVHFAAVAAMCAAALLGCSDEGTSGTSDNASTSGVANSANPTSTESAPESTAAPTTATPITVTIAESDLTIESWSSAPSLLHPRAAHGVVAVDGAIYVLGGIGESRAPVSEVERFDGTSWSDVTTLPGKGVNAPSVAAVDGRIYVIGGFSGTSNAPTDEVHVFDIATGTWSLAAPLPTASGGHAAVVLDGHIHVVGGGTSKSTIADHVVYDPDTDTWSSAAPLSRKKGSPAVTVLDGRIWAIAGRSGRDDFGEVEIYDPMTDQWVMGPEIEARGNAGAVTVCETIVVAGGQKQRGSSVIGDVEVLDGESWRPLAPLPTARAFARTVLLGDTIYVVGGSAKYGQSHATPGSGAVEFTTPTC